MRAKIVAGNWKLQGSCAFTAELVGALAAAGVPAGVQLVVVPPAPYLAQAVAAAGDSGIAVGGQDVSVHAKGAYTGEVAALMLADVGASHVLVGHSERRQYHGEDSALVAAKFQAAIEAGLQPILCVGESLAERDAGITEQVIASQLQPVIGLVGAAGLSRGLVAYEPVWAIGTGEVATPDDAQEVCGAIRARIREVHGDAAADGVRVLYGGSVKASNVAGIMVQEDVDGALVGGASLQAEEFGGICRFYDMPVL